MKKLIGITFAAIAAACIISPSSAFGEVVSWEASSGLLPSDAAIPADRRFELEGERAYLSLSGGILNFNDPNPVRVGFAKTDISPIPPGGEYAMEVRLRMNSHTRAVLDWGAYVGLVDGTKRVWLLVSSDRVGLAGDVNAGTYVNDVSYSLDTTDDFHVYRLLKSGDFVNLYVDDGPTPVLSEPYADFSNGTEVLLTLASTSVGGVSDFDVSSFAYNLNSTYIPEPATLSLLALGGLALIRRRKCRS